MQTGNWRTRRTGVMAAVVAAAALAVPGAASAAVTGTVSGTTATLTGDGAADTIVISTNAGLLQHNLGTATGFADPTDFDSTVAGPQVLPAATATLTIDVGGGDDIVVGGPNNDHILGGDGNDRITGFTGNDDVDGGNGNDTMIWNNGDGSDTNDGDAGVDETLITGRNTTDDMTVANNGAGRVLFTRAAPGGFTVDMGTVEKLSLTPFAGDDKLVTAPDVTLPLSVDAGPGIDTITTGAGADLVQGGDDADVLNGGAGGDRILGNPGNDVMNGGAGDDTLVWNNGDGTDDMNGDDGLDRIEDNLGAADDVSQLKVLNGKVRYDRVNAPFGLNVATSEVFELNTFGGNDTLDVAPGLGALIALQVDAGSGDDRIKGGDEADTFFGGLGNDTLDTGAGSDVADGQDGDDTLLIRDGAADLARGGAGTDSATVDVVDAVAADVEKVDRAKSGANALKLRKDAKVTRSKTGKYSARLVLTCDASALEGCKGRLSLLTATSVKIGGVRVQALLASAKYDVKAGKTRSVTVKLPSVAKRLAKNRTLKVKAQAISKDVTGSVTTRTANVTLKFPR
jgi:Ca2+-binding RTX toxin-like protein